MCLGTGTDQTNAKYWQDEPSRLVRARDRELHGEIAGGY